MPVSRCVLVVAFLLSVEFMPVDNRPSPIIRSRAVLGPSRRRTDPRPRWQELSRRAGIIFAGTVLGDSAPGSEGLAAGAVTSSVHLRFRVDRAIAGERGQILTIHEWAGASALHRPMVGGQHLLLFLYPPSRLGLTSPVDGSLGQILLDSRGEYLSKDELLRRNAMTALQTVPVGVAEQPSAVVSVEQLAQRPKGVAMRATLISIVLLFLAATASHAGGPALSRAPATTRESKDSLCSGRTAQCSTSPIKVTSVRFCLERRPTHLLLPPSPPGPEFRAWR